MDKWISKITAAQWPSQSKPTFTRFPDLPAELRLLVWQFASLVPRTVLVGLKNTKTRSYKDAILEKEEQAKFMGPKVAKAYAASAKPPSVLQTCFESREEALKIYSLCFVERQRNGSAQGSGIFISPGVDIIKLFPLCGSSHEHYLLGHCPGYSFNIAMDRYEPSSLECVEKLQTRRYFPLYPGSVRTKLLTDSIRRFFPKARYLELIVPWSRRKAVGEATASEIVMHINGRPFEAMDLTIPYEFGPQDLCMVANSVKFEPPEIPRMRRPVLYHTRGAQLWEEIRTFR